MFVPGKPFPSEFQCAADYRLCWESQISLYAECHGAMDWALKTKTSKDGPGSMVVEHSTHNPKIEGSNPTTATGREKIEKNEVWQQMAV